MAEEYEVGYGFIPTENDNDKEEEFYQKDYDS